MTPDGLHGPAVARTHRRLVVDDNIDFTESLALLLELTGDEVRTAYTGGSALAVAPAFQPEIVLLDLGLPDRNGLEVARQLRAQPLPAMRALMAGTADGTAEDRARTAAAGFDHHLVKPVEFAVLLTVLRTAA